MMTPTDEVKRIHAAMMQTTYRGDDRIPSNGLRRKVDTKPTETATLCKCNRSPLFVTEYEKLRMFRCVCDAHAIQLMRGQDL